MRHSTADPRVPTLTRPGCGLPPLVHRPQGYDERSTTFAHHPHPSRLDPARRWLPATRAAAWPRRSHRRVHRRADPPLHDRARARRAPAVACKTRRASRCAPCAEVYRADTYQLIRAGLTGGKGVPAEVAHHPCVFVTLTAPSFGPVHARRERGDRVLACRPRRNGRTCPHGVRLSCSPVHIAAIQITT